MSVFTLEALKARYGDALLLHAGTEAAPELVLIDGGASRVYDEALKPRLQQLRKGSDPLRVALMMVSHIDDDHINGILDLTTDLIEATDEQEQLFVEIEKLWHNSFADVIASEGSGSRLQESAVSLASAAVADPVIESLFRRPTRLVLESVRQGRRLRQDANRLGIPINRGFKGGLVLHDTAPETPVEIGGVKLRVIGPGTAEVEKLKKRWKKDVERLLEKEGDRAVMVQSAGGLDTSVFNLSSIVVLAEAESGNTMLLTGDARSDIMLEWMETAGDVLDDKGKLHVNLLKLPHHGSDRNVTPDFFERVTADHYVVSGDGRHGNPEPETLDWLLEARGDADFTIHMTYSPQELKEDDHYETTKLRKVLDSHAGSRARLRFPDTGEMSISVAL